MPGPFRVITLAEIPSTNAEAMRRGAAGETAPLWVVAERQTAGRGRSGRAWVSEPGNLYASLMVRPACGAAELARLSLVAGVAVIDTIHQLEGAPGALSLRLKWPNDILIGNAKAGGILIETSTLGESRGIVAVIGVGLNLAHHPAGIPYATSLSANGITIRPLDMLEFLAAAMEVWLGVWNEGLGFEAIRRAWLARAGAIGEPMAVHAGDTRVQGLFAGLDVDGALLLDDEAGRRRRFTFGDVTLIEPHETNAPNRT